MQNLKLVKEVEKVAASKVGHLAAETVKAFTHHPQTVQQVFESMHWVLIRVFHE